MERDTAPIAIIGIGCRLPRDIKNPEQLWQFLAAGHTAWSDVPTDRYNETAFYHPNPENNGTTNHRGGHFLDRDLAAFDAKFFGLSPLEAQALDPQQRLLLEVTYEALENAGISVEHARGSDTAVYVALFTHDHDRNMYKDPSDIPKFHITGSGDAIASNRISYTFDFKGPSMTLDTGCSGSLVALHQACQSLRTGESNMALASGVSLILSPDHMFAMSNLHMLNDNGKSYAFDARGSGYGRGEGATTVLLKRLDDALKAGDNIRAIIRNTAINQDGKTNGITFPNQQAQQYLAEFMCRSVGVEPYDIPYIEAHGTGTTAGDQIELQAIAKVFCSSGRRCGDLVVGSIKSNIGHLESSSGLAGLIKTVLVLEKGFIPPNADFQVEKLSLKLKDWGIRIPTALEPWPTLGDRRACVNSFGYGGTNAHVILESWSGNISGVENPKNLLNDSSHTSAGLAANADVNTLPSHMQSQSLVPVAGKINLMQLYVLTAKSRQSLLQVAARLKIWASEQVNFDQYFEHLAYNLAVRRSRMQWRYSFVAGSHLELMASLRQDIQGTRISKHRRIVFVFTGQGAQWAGMGQELLATENEFAESLRKSDSIIRNLGASWSLIDEIRSPASKSRLNESEFAQPACTAIQIALVDYLGTIGVSPHVVIGHSSGEISAAYAAGSLSHTSALKISYCRSFLSKQCEHQMHGKGAMLMVGLAEEEAKFFCERTDRGIVSIACVNSASSTTISGDEAAILEISNVLTQQGIFSRRLVVDTAYHSHHMQNVAHHYLCSLGVTDQQTLRDGMRFISTVSATTKTTDFGSEYWVSNLVSKVRFYEALQTCCYSELDAPTSAKSESTYLFIEIGPHKVLETPIRQTAKKSLNLTTHEYCSSLVRGRNAVHSLLELGGMLFKSGHPVDLSAINTLGSYRRQFKVLNNLPLYPWDYSQTYWHESRLSKDYRLRTHPPHDLLGVRMTSNTPLEPCWRHLINTDDLPWLADHMVDGLMIFPGAAYITMAIEAFRQCIHEMHNVSNYRYLHLRCVRFIKALIIPKAPASVELQFCFRSQSTEKILSYEFRVFAISQDQMWHEYCRGYIMVEVDAQPAKTVELDRSNNDQHSPIQNSPGTRMLLDRDAFKMDSKTIYSQLQSHGNFYGPSFARISELSLLDDHAASKISIADVESIMPYKYQQPHMIHPTTLDALMHAALPLYTRRFGSGSVMPVSIQKITISSDLSCIPGSCMTSAISMKADKFRSAQADISVFVGDKGTVVQDPVLRIEQATLRGLGAVRESNTTSTANNKYRIEWAPDIDCLCSHIDIEGGPTCVSVVDFVNHLRFKHARLNILEIGTGTVDRSTSPFIIASSENGGAIPVPQITITGFNHKELEQEQAISQSRYPGVQFKVLNIYQDPSHQGFQLNSFDLIIISRVRDEQAFGTALRNVRTLLKPGGRIVLVGGTPTQKSQNELVLLQNGFGSLEFTLKEAQSVSNSALMMSSKAIRHGPQTSLPPIRIIVEEHFQPAVQGLVLALEALGLRTSQASWSSDLSCHTGTNLILDNTQKPLLANATDYKFSQIASLLGGRSTVIWISSQQDSMLAPNPAGGLVAGFARSARAENTDLRLITIEVQNGFADCLPPKSMVFRNIIFEFSRESWYGHPWVEAEYIYKDGQLLIPRLLQNTIMDDWLTRDASGTRLQPRPYSEQGSQVFLKADAGSQRGSSWVVNDETAHHPVEPSMVEITTRAHLLDLPAIADSPNLPAGTTQILQAFSGTVSVAGSSVKNRYQVGDRVCAWTFGEALLANRIRVDYDSVSKLPESVKWSSAASIPIPFMTAYYVLVEIGDLQKGQSILVHRATNDAGKAAIQIAALIGAKILATVSTSAERDELSTQFKIPTHRILLDGAMLLSQAVLHATGNKGVDLVFNDFVSDWVYELASCVAPFGSFVHVVPYAAHFRDKFPSFPALPQTTFVSFDLVSLIKYRPQRVVGLLDKVMSMIEHGDRVILSPVTTVPISEIQGPLRKALAGKHVSKIVLECDETTQVEVPTDHVSESSRLRKHATYIIAGGLGALGKKICRFMAQCGAINIIILSRRPMVEKERQALEAELRLISVDLRVFIITCDISKSTMLETLMSTYENLKLPPIRGVVQSATVLQDRVLEQMTAHDFQVPLQTKFHGTLNLSRMFDTTELDFFIMLSSLSGIVGSRGQANYAAGNTFQDALANSKKMCGMNYLALDLGMMVESDAYNDDEGQVRTKNLVRQGWLSMKDKELLSLLRYAISTEAYQSPYRQIVTGIDGRSIHEAANPTAAIQGAMFSHIRSSYISKDGSKSKEDTGSWQLAVKSALSSENALQIIIDALSQQLSNITAVDSDKIARESPLLELGLDSLLAIELKNWISQEFDAQIQASEILDEPSLVALGMKVATRSSLVEISAITKPEIRASKTSSNSELHSANEPITVKVHGLNNRNKTTVNLQRLPIPDLSSTLDLYITSARPFLTTEQLQHTSITVEQFRGGIGQQLQQRLIDRSQDSRLDNWQYQLQVDCIYLKRRAPLHPYSTFYGVYVVTNAPHSQAERAALISMAAFNFKQSLEAGGLEQDHMNEEPLCMDSLQWLFNTTREPGIGIDKICKYPGNDYVVAIRRGQFFKVQLAENKMSLPYSKLKTEFEAIQDLQMETQPSVASLTAEKRDAWADLRKAVISLEAANEELLSMIEAAAFVVCLDDGSPTTPSQRSNQFLLGDPRNRWSDKSLQFVICENGASGYICEHTMLDAASMRLLNKFVTHALVSHEIGNQVQTHSSDRRQTAKPYQFTVDAAIQSAIVRVESHFRATYAPIEFSLYEIPDLGRKTLHKYKMSSRTGLQLIIQLAALIYFGRQHPSWETVTTMPFAKGRLDWIQAVSEPMVAFCRAAIDDSVPDADLYDLLKRAAITHTSLRTRVARGHGYAAHLEALREVLRDDEPVPTMFEDTTWEMMHVTHVRKLKTDASDGLMVQEGGFFMPDPESVFVHYEADEEKCLFYVQSTEGRATAFCNALTQATKKVRSLLDGQSSGGLAQIDH